MILKNTAHFAEAFLNCSQIPCDSFFPRSLALLYKRFYQLFPHCRRRPVREMRLHILIYSFIFFLWGRKTVKHSKEIDWNSHKKNFKKWKKKKKGCEEKMKENRGWTIKASFWKACLKKPVLCGLKCFNRKICRQGRHKRLFQDLRGLFESEIQGINGRDREIRSNCESVESRESLGSTDVI